MSIAEGSQEEHLGKTLNIYRQLAIAMNSFPRERDVSIRDLAEAAQVHYNTAKKALLFFHQIDSVIPKFQIEESGFRVVSKPNALEAVEGIFESLEMRIVTKMMLSNAIDSDKAQKLDEVLTEEERNMLPKLIEKGLVNSFEGRYFLSSRGLSLGSMGLSRIVRLNIPLPWENRATQPQREVRFKNITWSSVEEYQLHTLGPHCFSSWTTGYKSSRRVRAKLLFLRSRKERRFVSANL